MAVVSIDPTEEPETATIPETTLMFVIALAKMAQGNLLLVVLLQLQPHQHQFKTSNHCFSTSNKTIRKLIKPVLASRILKRAAPHIGVALLLLPFSVLSQAKKCPFYSLPLQITDI